ncbi:unnamed protein product, partial [Amoebophrya sp. A120]
SALLPPKNHLLLLSGKIFFLEEGISACQAFLYFSLKYLPRSVLVPLSLCLWLLSEQLGVQHQFGVGYFCYSRRLQAGRREGLKCKGCKRQHANFSYVLSDKNLNFFEAMARF